VGAIQGDVAELEQLEFAGQLQDIDEALAERFEVLAAELADRVVVGMGPRRQVTDRHVAVGGTLDLARGKQAVGVAVDQQRQHHVGRELFGPRAPVVDAEALQRQAVHRLDHEMDQVVLGHPIPQVGRQKHRRVTVYGNKARGHELRLSNCGAGSKSDRLLGSTAIGEVMTITTVFNLGAFTTPSTDIASFEEGVIQQGMSHQQGNASFAFGLAAGLFYNVSSGEVLLKAAQGSGATGKTSSSLGAASGLGGSTITLSTTFTKTAADTWTVAATAGGASLSYTANGQDSALDNDGLGLGVPNGEGGGIIGGFQALPSGGGSPGVATPPFGSTTVTDYTITVVPEPSIALLGGLGLLGLLRRRR
jgi:hypothetical protein